jgi:hypothetical protein
MRKAFGRARFVDTWLLRFALDDVREFHRRTVDFISDETARFEGHVSSLINGLPEEEQAEIVDRYMDDLAQIRTTFPAILHSSMLLFLCSQFEHGLADICKGLAREKKKTIAAEDMFKRDNGLVRSGKYMRHIGLKFPANKHWNRLLFIGRVRNCLAHAGGRPRPELLREIKKETSLTVDQFGCGSSRRHESRYLTRLRWARPTSFNGRTVGGGAAA